MSCSAEGIADSGSEKLGLYFDTDAFNQCVDAEPFLPVMAYIILTNPSFESLHRWEGAIRPASGRVVAFQPEFLGGGANSGSLPEFSVSYEEPLAAQSVMVLATFQLMSLDPSSCLILTGLSSPAIPEDLPLIWSEAGVPTVIETARMTINGVVAALGECQAVPEAPLPCSEVVSEAGMNWGGLKSLYR
jgi:hypothetical protein